MFENPHYGKNVSFFENDNTVTDQVVISACKEKLYNLRFLVVSLPDFAEILPKYTDHFFYELFNLKVYKAKRDSNPRHPEPESGALSTEL